MRLVGCLVLTKPVGRMKIPCALSRRHCTGDFIYKALAQLQMVSPSLGLLNPCILNYEPTGVAMTGHLGTLLGTTPSVSHSGRSM